MNNSDFYNEDNDEELFTYGEDPAADLKFRSIRVDTMPHADHFSAFQQHSVSFNAQHTLQFLKPEQNSKSSSETSASGCPSAPFGVSKNSFNIINSNYATVVQQVTTNLCNHEHFDFSFCDDEYMWKGRYLCGSSSFDLEVNLYHDMATQTFTVAVRKISCDCSVNGCFNTFFGAMKTALCNDGASCAPARKPFCIPMKCSLVTVTDEEFLEGVQSIFKMTACGLQARVQGVKMLCDVAQKDAHFLELSAFRPQCVQLLEALVQDESDEVRQHAVMAVAAFAELNSYREAFMHSSVLVALFCLVENCQYETAQMRRTAARVLALLCRTHPYSVRSELQQQSFFDLAGWLQRVACLQDTRTREAAQTVKSFLEDVSLPELDEQHGSHGLVSEDEAALFALSH